ncbi:MAG: FKBP-type peptidyl-prolyl cis-trans isomerase [Bacteroidia bacterium]
MKKLFFAVLASGLLFTACKQGGGSSASFANQQDSVSYALGYANGKGLGNMGIDVNPERFMSGYVESLDEKASMDQMQLQMYLQQFQQEVRGRNQQPPFTAENPPSFNLDTMSYVFGALTASDFVQTGLRVNSDLISTGLKEGLEGKSGAFDSLTIQNLMNTMQGMLQTSFEEKQKVEGEKNQQEGEAFLAENKTKEGVVELPSGLQYKVLEAGSGASPTIDDKVSAHYEGRLINGDVFDSSYERGQPAIFAVNGVIPGWTEALKMMKPGAKWQLFIPGDLAYGLRGSPPKIGPNAVLVFDVELLEIK